MGKRLRVSEFDMQVGKDDHELSVYAVFKEEKRGDVLAIYSDNKDENKDILHYASVHMKNDTIVFIDVKNKEEIVKEFTWKLLNDKENEGFVIIDIKDYSKAEIVSSNELLVKSEVISKLYEKTIPKVELEQTNNEKVKEKKSSRILFRGFSLAICVVIAFCVVNKDLIMGKNLKYTCVNAYLDTEVGTNKEDIESLAFNYDNKLTSRVITTKYIFSDETKYKDYVNIGTYYNIKPKFSTSTPKYVEDEANKTFSIVEEVILDAYYNGKNTKDELLKELTDNNYQCTKVSE